MPTRRTQWSARWRKAGIVAVLIAAASIGMSAPVPRFAPSRAPGGQDPAMIRSIVLKRSDGGYSWSLGSIPMPAITDHQLLVHVRAVALNRDDFAPLGPIRSADLSGEVMGSDAAGDIVAVGGAVTGFRVGERVTNTYFRNWTDGVPSRAQIDTGHGARVAGVAAEYIALDDTAVVPMPRGYSYEEGATLPTAGLTAWMATAGRYSLGRGTVVLIEGTGGVSTFAMQFAAATGARIILTSSSDGKLKETLRIAPHDSINYQSLPAWSRRVRELTAGRGADLVVEVGGKSTLPQALQSLAPDGTLSLVGGLTGYDGEIPAGMLLGGLGSVRAVFVGSRADFRAMNAFIEKNRLHPVIDRVFALEDYARALELLRSGHFVGKIVLRMDSTPGPAAG